MFEKVIEQKPSKLLELSIAVMIGFAYACLLLVFSFKFVLCFTIAIVAAIYFVRKPKGMLYFLVLMYPCMTIIINGSQAGPNDSYTGINMGGILNIFTVMLTGFLLLARHFKLPGKSIMLPALIIFLGIIALSIIESPFKLISLREWFRYAVQACCYFLVLFSLRDRNDRRNFLEKIFYLSTILPIVFALYQIIHRDFTFAASGLGLGRAYGTFAHPNSLAMFIVISMLLGFYLLSSKKGKDKFLTIGYLFFCGVVLLFTFTRIAWFSFAIAFMVFGFLKFRKELIFFIVFVLILSFFAPALQHKVAERLKPEGSYWLRFKLNSIGMEAFKQKPILGHGIGMFPFLSRSSVGDVTNTYGFKTGLVAHNDYMRFLATTGILGLLAFLYMFYRAFKIVIKLKSRRFVDGKNYWVFLLSFLIALLVYAISDQSFEVAGIYFWVFIAIGELSLSDIAPTQE